MSNRNSNRTFDKNKIKQAASGNWPTIVSAITGLSGELFVGKGKPCPKCAGTDRFSAFPDFIDSGGLLCRQCHNSDTKPKNGDGIATVQWLTGCEFPEALRLIAEQVGIAPVDAKADKQDILADLCKQKQMPIESAKAYGAETAIRGRQQVVRFPVYDPDGNATSYSDVSPYATGKLNKGMLPKGGKAGLHLPGRLPKSGETWLIVEGVKDAAALHALGFNAAGLTGNTMKQSFVQLFAGCNIVLVPDLDRASLRGLAKTGSALLGVVESVWVAMLPGEVKPTKGDDVRDVIGRDGEDTVRLAIESAEGFDAADMFGNRPAVQIAIDDATEPAVANKAIRILARQGFATNDTENRIYQRGGKLVAVAETDSGPQIISLDETGIRERISAAMDLVETSTDSKGEETEKHCRPPGWLCKAIHSRPNYLHVRRLDGVVTAPTIRRDGSILQTAGYDKATRLLYVPDGDYPAVLENPTDDDVANATGELLALISDFPFANNEAKSVWMALVFTLAARSAINGNVPLFGFTANIRGSGKSKLCDLAGLIAYGRMMARKTLPGNDDETRKVITAVAIEAKPAVLLDNATSLIGGASLDAVLTSDTWNDRILGKSETTGDLPWRTVLMVTGNNLGFQADTARRVILCQLDCQHETPEDRDDFQHANIELYVSQNRERFVVAALTVLRAFFVAGRPYTGKRLGSFESWSETICGAVVFARLPNPLETVSVVRQQDNTGTIVRTLLDGIAAVGGVDGVSSKEISEMITADSKSESDDWELLRAAFAEITDKPTPRKIGGILKRYLNRVCGGRRLVKKPGRSNLTRWAVETLETVNGNASDGEICSECERTLIENPTFDGFTNMYCESCDRVQRCFKNAA